MGCGYCSMRPSTILMPSDDDARQRRTTDSNVVQLMVLSPFPGGTPPPRLQARPSLPPSSLLLAPAQCHIHIFQSLSVSKGDDFCRRASPCMDGRGRTWTFARSLDRLCSWALGNAGRRQRHSFEPFSSSVTEGEHFLLLFVVLRALT